MSPSEAPPQGVVSRLLPPSLWLPPSPRKPTRVATMHFSAEGVPAEVDPYRERNGIFAPPDPVPHREDVYDSQGFELLAEMQHQHFWFSGRHRFLLHAVQFHLTP